MTTTTSTSTSSSSSAPATGSPPKPSSSTSATLPASGRAIVKSVLSGDGVVLRGKPVNGPPPERILSFANIIAPRLGSASDPSKEEPGAFESREFLRKLLVGKEVAYRVEYTTTTNARDYGSLVLAPPGVDGETQVTRILVKNGWVKVKPSESKKGPSDDYTILTELEAAAQVAGLGIWATGKPARNVVYSAPEEPRAFLEKNKGRPIDAIVEQVRDANTYRLILLLREGSDSVKHQYLGITLAGIKAPTYRVGVPKVEDLIEPFSEEAKYFVESRLLQRDVKVLLEGVSSNNGFVGTIIHPAGNISEVLVGEGFATVVSWQVAMVTGGPAKLRAAEQKAKDKKLRLWKSFVAKEKGGAGGIQSEFDGIVIRINTSDSVSVVPASMPDGPEHKIYFASVRPPRAKEPKEAGYAVEAKEFLRQKLIGKNVRVTIDFVKPADGEYEARNCGSIFVGGQNIAELLIANGLATALRHRKDDDNRSTHYDALLLAEDAAQKAGKGMHSTKAPPVWSEEMERDREVKTAQKAKQLLPFMQRSGNIAGVVEFASSGSRFKIWAPSQNKRITLVLAGLRTPRAGRLASEQPEPFGQEALDFVKRRFLQRDVEFQVEACDKTGGFIGSLFLIVGGRRENVAITLLEHGLATVHDYSASQSNFAGQLYSAEKKAQEKRIGIWSLRDPEAEAREREAAAAAEKEDKPVETKEVYVSEIGSAGSLYVQVVSPELSKLESLMADFAAFHADKSVGGVLPKVGDYVSAKFTVDDSWYRAQVKAVNDNKTYVVFFIDYGNAESVPLARIRPLDSKFSTLVLAPQATEAKLALISVPSVDADFGDAAVERFREETEGRKMTAKIFARTSSGGAQVLHVALYPIAAATGSSKSQKEVASINEVLLADGLATVEQSVAKRFEADKKAGAERGSFRKDFVAALMAAQETGRKDRVGMWRYGDFLEDDV
ncbi:hypothetical protein DFJ73DRAFT_853383 [Zopfochytrium polystomum]|nr:hypothetical protein DFJ73DRAFT_853383 [Zopfochytrium polystomum]